LLPLQRLLHLTITTTCLVQIFCFTNNSTGGNSYQWTFGSGTGAPPQTTLFNPTVNFNPNVGTGTTTYNVKLVVTSTAGCKDSTTSNVTVKRRPDARIDTNHTNWDGIQGMFVNCGPTRTSPNFTFSINNASNTSSSNTGYIISWGDNTSSTLAGTFSTTSHNYTSVGMFDVVITAFDTISGCSSSRMYQSV
jgi:hypothetical protein